MLKLYYYDSNIKNVRNGRYIPVIAQTKKDALKFVKEFEGLTIGSRTKSYTGSKANLSIDEIMKQQSNILKQLLSKESVIIDNEKGV